MESKSEEEKKHDKKCNRHKVGKIHAKIDNKQQLSFSYTSLIYILSTKKT